MSEAQPASSSRIDDYNTRISEVTRTLESLTRRMERLADAMHGTAPRPERPSSAHMGTSATNIVKMEPLNTRISMLEDATSALRREFEHLDMGAA